MLFEKFDYSDIETLALELPIEINCYKYAGDFEGEIQAIDRYLSKNNLNEKMVARLTFEKFIAGEMKNNYKTDFESIYNRLKEEFPNLTVELLEQFIDQGHGDFIVKNGKRMFENAAYSNLRRIKGDYLRKLADPDYYDRENFELRNENRHIMRENGSRAFKYTIRQWIKPVVSEEYADKIIRVHLPFPVECLSQSNIKLLNSSDDPYISNAEQRTVFFEKPYVPGEKFFIEYTYVNKAVYKEISPLVAKTGNPGFYLDEQYPHVRFTPYIKMLADDLKGNETNPLLLARRAYEWVTHNVGYSYVRPYFCLDNISEFAAINRRGDCGVMSTLFITLCRAMGVPAKWESGLYTTPNEIGWHDWAMFYVEPYGWLYADLSMGESTVRYGEKNLYNHYFGNLDPFRTVFCNDFQKQFEPPKSFMRCDPYDNQMGEAEFEDAGLFFGDWECGKEVISAEEIK